MLELLQTMGYRPPAIQEGVFGEIEISHNVNASRFHLLVRGHQWMAYTYSSHEEAYDVFSHYCLARGHVVTTGLGFGAREGWILSKPDVTKLTVIERCQDLIDYHVRIGTPWLNDPRVEICCADADRYCTRADVLLLDHYEQEQFETILESMRRVQNNIASDILWAWPMERIIMHCRKWHSDNDPPGTLLTKHEAYQRIKQNHNLSKLPDLSPAQINLFCMMYNSKLFSRSEDFLGSLWNDRQTFHEIYRHI